MIAFERLGVVLKNGEPVYGGATTAKFNAGMAVKNDKVHMLYRYAEQLEDTSDVYKSPYAVDHICHATLTLDGELLSDDETPVIKCDTKYDSTGCQDPRIVYFEGEYYNGSKNETYQNGRQEVPLLPHRRNRQQKGAFGRIHR